MEIEDKTEELGKKKKTPTTTAQKTSISVAYATMEHTFVPITSHFILSIDIN